MRDGYRIIDVDTHVTPSLEVLSEYVEPSFRPRLEELRPYQRTMRSPAGRGHPLGEWTTIKVRPIPYERIAGQKPGVELIEAGGAGPLEAHVQNLAREDATERVQHDNPEGRLHDMDVEGVDVDLINSRHLVDRQLRPRRHAHRRPLSRLPPLRAQLLQPRSEPPEGPAPGARWRPGVGRRGGAGAGA